ncbi:restriction endonuclease [Candidatus Woesearchaeota archaeon]|nr:restriction endonuclease [Candidatus Woesearchaeota archaeon]
MDYSKCNFKIPKEEDDYQQCSEFVIKAISKIIKEAIDNKKNKIVINTNLKLGLPMENVNKVAGPFVEAWAHETFCEIVEDTKNEYHLVNVEAGERLNMADIILQFQKKRKNQSSITSNVDVKATAEDIESSGKSPNITSYARIRCAYLEDPDYMFIILSLKHKVYSKRDEQTKLMNGIMEVFSYNAYDLKNISSADISYNPALGTGQLQIRDIHYVKETKRTTWEFCQLLDKKYIASKNGFDPWFKLAKKFGWIKDG